MVVRVWSDLSLQPITSTITHNGIYFGYEKWPPICTNSLQLFKSTLTDKCIKQTMHAMLNVQNFSIIFKSYLLSVYFKKTHYKL